MHYNFFFLRYDLKDTSKITLIDIQLLAAMGPPGGGRNPVSPRFLRHFNICTINSFSDETMIRIFSTVVALYLRSQEFPPDYFSIGNQIVTATLEVRGKCLHGSLLCPVKFLYLYNNLIGEIALSDVLFLFNIQAHVSWESYPVFWLQ